MIRIFDMMSSVYEGVTSQETWRENCEEIAALFPDAEGSRILDIGCGPANSTMAYARVRPDATVIGADFSAGMLVRARDALRREGMEGRVHLARTDALEMPFAENTFDVVTGHSFLYLLPDPRAVLVEARRVLRPGGACVFMEPARPPFGATAYAAGKSFRFLASSLGWRVMSRWKGRFTPGSLRALLESAGLDVASVEATLGGLGLTVAARRE